MAPKVLIIEDDADTRLGLSVRLRASGFAISVAGDGATGVMLAQRERPDIILLDLGLPAGDGLTVLQRLKSNSFSENIAVIILSARDPEVNRPKALALGAAVYLEKPCEPAELLSELRKLLPANPTDAPHAEKSGKVLVVDDDADTRRGMGIRLRASGLEPIFATDGLSAISAAARERPDLILLDLGLPAGDGLTVLERLAKHHTLCSIPVVVISGRSAEVAQEKALALGAKAYLQKPVAVELLLETVSRILTAKESGRIPSAA